MTLTNPDSLLDKNGLAYYHGKVKQTISDAVKVTINVTQSAHQTIGYLIEGGHDAYMEPTNNIQPTYYESPISRDLYLDSAKFTEMFSIVIYLMADDGYNIGTPVLVLDGRTLTFGGYADIYELTEEELNQYDYFVSYEGGKYIIYFAAPYGSTLDISMTPATIIPTRTVTLKQIQTNGLTYGYTPYVEYTSGGNTTTVNFSTSQDVTFECLEGTSITCYGSSYVMANNEVSEPCFMNSSFEITNSYVVGDSNLNILCEIQHAHSRLFAYIRITGQSQDSIIGAVATITYTHPDNGRTITETQQQPGYLRYITFTHIPYTAVYTLTISASGYTPDTSGNHLANPYTATKEEGDEDRRFYFTANS